MQELVVQLRGRSDDSADETMMSVDNCLWAINLKASMQTYYVLGRLITACPNIRPVSWICNSYKITTRFWVRANIVHTLHDQASLK